jgi:ATP-dependent Lon protease
MDIENLFKKLDKYIDSYESAYTIHPKYKTKFHESISLMKSHIDILTQDKTIENFDSKKTPQIIEECISYLNITTSENQVNEKLKQFCLDYCFLTSNWNQNVLKSQPLNSKIQYMLRIINQTLTLTDSLSILKHLNKKLEKQLNWRPPTFELSDHYYKLLKE